MLNAMAAFLNSVTDSDELMRTMLNLRLGETNLEKAIKNNSEDRIKETKNRIGKYQEKIDDITAGVMLELTCPLDNVRPAFQDGCFVVAYYKADRIFKAFTPNHVEKVVLKNGYSINETPREDFVKYMLDMKMTQALAISNGKQEKAEKIRHWFDDFENLLKKIFEDDSVRLKFDEDTFRFHILMKGREPFDFNTLSSGYAAVLDIVVDLIIRMGKQTNRVFNFTMPGIVLIDEIETHLHLELQRRILDLLTTIFPNIQFIVTTHSPFILNSLENVVIYDLEKHLLVKDGLTDVPYDGIVEGYFHADLMSMTLRKK